MWERGSVLDLVERAIDLDPLEALLLQFGKVLFKLALAPAHDGGQQVKARPLAEPDQAVDHLGDGLRRDGKSSRG